jgi:hypothetical protein
VFRRQLLDVCGIAPRPGDPRAPGPMAHDTWVMFLAGAFGRTAALQAELALYRQHPNNVAGVRAPRYVPDASDYDRQASLADEYARELRRIADSAPAAAFRGHLLRTADAWVMVAADNRTRAALYATPTRGGRVRRLAAAVGRGHYFRRTPGALGARSLVKDSVVAIRPGHGTAPSASS